jgi:hypothetical protein
LVTATERAVLELSRLVTATSQAVLELSRLVTATNQAVLELSRLVTATNQAVLELSRLVTVTKPISGEREPNEKLERLGAEQLKAHILRPKARARGGTAPIGRFGDELGGEFPTAVRCGKCRVSTRIIAGS